MNVTHDSLFVHIPIDEFVEFLNDLNDDINIQDKYRYIFNLLPKLRRYEMAAKTINRSTKNPCSEIYLESKEVNNCQLSDK